MPNNVTPNTAYLTSPSTHKEFKINTLGFKVTLLSTAAYIAPFFISFPLASFIQIIGLGVLTTVSAGVIDNQLAYQQCKDFFKIKYDSIRQQFKTVPTVLIAAADGMQRTWELGLAAGVSFAITARAMQFVALSALSVTPLAFLGTIGTIICVHLSSKKKEAEYGKNDPDIIKEAGQHGHLSQVSPDQIPAYRATENRAKWMTATIFISSLIVMIVCIAIRVFLTVTGLSF